MDVIFCLVTSVTHHKISKYQMLVLMRPDSSLRVNGKDLALSKTRGRGARYGRKCGRSAPRHQPTPRPPRSLSSLRIHRVVQRRPSSRSHQCFLALERRNQAYKPFKCTSFFAQQFPENFSIVDRSFQLQREPKSLSAEIEH